MQQIYEDRSLNCCEQLCKLHYLKCRNQHALFSVLARDNGTNHSTKQRVLLLMVYTLIIMSATAIFYDTDYHHVNYKLNLFCHTL